jgi:general secretion pathway protein C
MVGTSRRSGWLHQMLAAFYLAGAAFLVAHITNAFIEDSLLVLPATVVPVPAQSSPPPQPRAAVRLAEEIAASGIFPLPGHAGPQALTGQPAPPRKPPLEIAKKLRLMGTVVGNGRGAAVIELIASKQQRFVHLHDTIPEVGVVSEIRRDGVVIRQDDQEELLVPALLQENQPRILVAPTAVHTQPISKPPRRTLDRREVMESVSDPTKLMMQAHATPFITNGTLKGFRLDFVAPASFFEKAGFQHGDVIQRVNGVEIRDPGRALSVFQQVANERLVEVDILRAHQRTTLAYELR